MKERFKLVVLAALLLLPWIFFDIDLGDQSYHSLGSWLMAFHPKMPTGELPFWFEQVPVWFSYFVDSLWWRLIGPEAPLLFVRFGWIIFQVSILLALYEIFIRIYSPREVLASLLLGLMAVNCGADQFVLSYYVVPPAFGALAFALLALGFRKGAPACFFLAGIFLMFSIQARLPSAVPLIFCAAIIFLVNFVLNKGLRREPKYLAFFLFGGAAGLLISIVCLVASGQGEYFVAGIQGFWRGVSDASNQRYSKALILERALGHYIRIGLGMLIFGSFLAALKAFKWGSVWIFLMAVCGAFLVSVAKYGTILSAVIGGSVLILALYYWQARKRPEAWQVAFLIGALGCVSAFTLGTYLEGVQTFKYGLWLLVPLAYLTTSGREWKECRALLCIFVGVLFLTTRFLWPTFPFLERPIFRMNTGFNIRGTTGLFTYPDKAENLKSLVDELGKQGVKSGEELFVYSGVPTYYPVAGIYLLTRTVPFLHDPGIVEYPGARWKAHRDILNELASKGLLPKIIVRQKNLMARVSPSPMAMLKESWLFNPEPSKDPFRWSSPADNNLAGETDEILRSNGYLPVWENSYFVILRKA